MLSQTDFSSHPHITISVERMDRSSCKSLLAVCHQLQFLFQTRKHFSPSVCPLAHQSLFYLKRALRLPLSFDPASLSHHNPRTRFKKRSHEEPFLAPIISPLTYNYLQTSLVLAFLLFYLLPTFVSML